MTENVECSTCDGRGWIVVNQTIGWPHGEQVQCPDCTPENVEEFANPDPGPGIMHDFHCTHDPCRCTERYSVEARTVAYTTDLTWTTEWCVYDRRRRICTATNERQARKIAAAMNAATPENVEPPCDECNGMRFLIRCPVCGGGGHTPTPENAETPRWTCSCGQTFTHGYGAHPCPDNGGREVRRMKPIEVEFTPENVEEP